MLYWNREGGCFVKYIVYIIQNSQHPIGSLTTEKGVNCHGAARREADKATKGHDIAGLQPACSTFGYGGRRRISGQISEEDKWRPFRSKTRIDTERGLSPAD